MGPAPGRYIHIERSGGLDLTLSLEAKVGARSPSERKILGSSGTTGDKNLDRIPRIHRP